MLLETPPARRTSEDEAAALAREIHGIEATAAALPGEYDDNFHLTAGDGRQFVLKVMHPARERTLVQTQCSALEHLAKKAAHLPVPRVIPTKKNEAFAAVELGGAPRLVWMLSFLPGMPLAKVRPHTAGLLRELGRYLGELDTALRSFSHPAAHRELKWDSSRALWIREYLGEIPETRRRALVETFLALYEAEVQPRMAELRRSVIYGDANDYNVLVNARGARRSEGNDRTNEIAGVIDFGDMHHGLVVSEPAIAAAYAILGKSEPLAAATALVSGYHSAFPLHEEELSALYTLIGMRLAVSVTNSAHRKRVKPDDAYVTVSETPAWEALEKWSRIPPRFATYAFRQACGLSALPDQERRIGALRKTVLKAASVLAQDLRREPGLVLDLSAGSAFLGADPRATEPDELERRIAEALRRAKASVAIGRYDEARLLYSSPLFGSNENPVAERRTVHLGLDLFAEAGTEVHAPLDGVVHAFANNTAALDYGPVVILEHRSKAKEPAFYTLYGHLSRDSLKKLRVGQRIARGKRFAKLGKTGENGGWAPHLHFQVILDLLGLGTDFPGVVKASEREVWTSLSPDPNLLLGIPAKRFPRKDLSAGETLAARTRLFGKNLSLSYERPLKIVRGWKQYLYDETGRAYLDVYNNVPLVGHSHPRVAEAAAAQLALLNTNTRYLHDKITEYAERLTRLMPEPLRVCFFVNSGSEANELALRLARAHTKREDMIVLEHAYHGHTNTLIDVSPYKFDGPGGTGRKAWVHVAPLADDYRGAYRRDDPRAGEKYAAGVAKILEQLSGENRGAAAFLAETLPSVGGQIVFPSGYLKAAYGYLRAAGVVCIADEVQVGFGRLGTHFWGFETQGVVPDVVVLGKPIGNAFPLAAVVTTREIADSFANGMEFFSTFGGNPVACAAGLAVLDVLRDERLQENALAVGSHLKTKLRELQERHELIGDVRGSGLFLGVDLVSDRETREAATKQAGYVVNRLRELGVLAGTDGPHHNVLKLRPPLIFSRADADLFVRMLNEVLSEDAAQP